MVSPRIRDWDHSSQGAVKAARGACCDIWDPLKSVRAQALPSRTDSFVPGLRSRLRWASNSVTRLIRVAWPRRSRSSGDIVAPRAPAHDTSGHVSDRGKHFGSWIKFAYFQRSFRRFTSNHCVPYDRDKAPELASALKTQHGWAGFPCIILRAVRTIDEMGSMLSELGERKFYAAIEEQMLVAKSCRQMKLRGRPWPIGMPCSSRSRPMRRCRAWS